MTVRRVPQWGHGDGPITSAGTVPVVLDCPARHGAGWVTLRFGERKVTIEVGANEPAACIAARLAAAMEQHEGNRTMTKQIRITDDGGQTVDVAHEFTADRVIVSYRGIYIFADRIDADTFELSGIPASDDEKAVEAALVATVETTTTVTT